MPDRDASALAEKYLSDCMSSYDSAGGVIECVIDGVPAGLGDPVFEKLDANLAKAVMSVGGRSVRRPDSRETRISGQRYSPRDPGGNSWRFPNSL